MPNAEIYNYSLLDILGLTVQRITYDFVNDWGPIYMDAFSFENGTIPLRFHLPFALIRYDEYEEYYEPQPKVSRSENAMTRKQTVLKTHLFKTGPKNLSSVFWGLEAYYHKNRPKQNFSNIFRSTS